jgi:carbon starvation protein
MFEALFILTTIDAGTRVGRFLMQDLLGKVWAPLGQTRSTLGNWVASAAFVAAWGWFLYEGVIDPLGGINSLWPIFGVANQLLAVLALALGTTVLIKMGRVRYLWVSLVPLAWLLAVTMTAGWMKIFSDDSRIGFLRAAADLKKKLAAAGDTPIAQVRQWQHMLTNNYINAAVTGAFMVLVLLVVGVCVREWWRLLSRRQAPVLREEPYVEVLASSASFFT